MKTGTFQKLRLLLILFVVTCGLTSCRDKINNADKTERAENTAYDSDIELFFKNAVAAYVNSVIFSSMLESAVCEQCARIAGMDAAVKNSDKIIDSLTLQYNQMRQSLITQEIAEIVGGANTFGE